MPKKNCDILTVDPLFVDKQVIGRAASRINDGGLVVFPTNTFYGLGARALDAVAVEKVYQAKKRDPAKPLLILIARLADLSGLVQRVPDRAERIIKAFWPGRVTLVFHAKSGFPGNLTGHRGKIGIRLARHPVAKALVQAVGGPVTATSANLSGNMGAISVDGLDQEMLEYVDLVLDAGELSGGTGSTVLDVTVDPPAVLREGTIRASEIQGVLDQ
jgi:L-threonylcarbamoyladenylate synthase